MKRYEGYHEDQYLPIRPGETVTIPKGTSIRSTNPSRKTSTAGRTYKVRVDHVLCGSSDSHLTDPSVARGQYRHRSNPEVRWAGAGNYWCWVDINDVPEAQRAVERKPVYCDEVFEHGDATVGEVRLLGRGRGWHRRGDHCWFPCEKPTW